MHELEVVDHDQPDASVLAPEPAAAGVKLGRRQGGLVDDEDVGAVQHLASRGEPRPVVVPQRAGPNPLLVDSPERGEHSHGELLGRHLHAEHDDRQLGADRRRLDDVHRERGLPHRGPPRDDHQVAVLQARGLAIEIRESGRHPGDRVFTPRQLVDALHHAGEHVLYGYGLPPARAASLRDLEDAAFGVVEQIGHSAALGTERRIRDLGAGPDQVAEHRALADDLRVRDDVRGAGGVLGELGEVGEATGRFELTVPVEPLGDGDGIAWLTVLAQARDRVEHRAVVAAIEVRPGEDVGDPVPGAVVDEHSPQHRLLGLDRVRRDAKRGGAGPRGGVVGERFGHVRENTVRRLPPSRAKAARGSGQVGAGRPDTSEAAPRTDKA